MRTSDPDIFAVGDAVEVRDFVTGEWSLIALAGPANRQARIAADVIAGRDSRFRGTQGTSVVELFGAAVAWTGANEKTLERLGDTDFEKIYLYPNSHAGYYPGAKPIAMKVIFRKSDGRVLGAQAVGEDGVDKRISDLALAIQLGATVYDLEAGRALLLAAVRERQGSDQLRRDGRRRRPARRHAAEPLGLHRRRFLLDVREKLELAVEHVPGSGQHPARRAARPPRRAPPRPRDPRHLPLRPARLQRDTRCCCRTASTPGSSPAACCRTRSSRRHDPNAIIDRCSTMGPTNAAPGSPLPARPSRPCSAKALRWDARRGELLRVDILAGTRLPRRVDDDRRSRPVRTYQVPGTVGAIAPVHGDDGWLLAAGRGFVHLSPDGSLRPIAEVAPAGTRMNDAACDPQGRFWAGTLADDHHEGGGALYRLDRTDGPS